MRKNKTKKYDLTQELYIYKFFDTVKRAWKKHIKNKGEKVL